MPLAQPPETATASPHTVTLPSGTRLWRVHRQSRPATAFKDAVSDAVFGGGRFDATSADRYSYLYAASEPETAVLETRLRDVPFDSRGVRTVRRVAVADHRLSPVVVVCDLRLVSLLSTPDLAAVYQDEWLIHSEVVHYPQTRRWGHWLREQDDRAHGFIWPSIRDLGRQSVVVFGDRFQQSPLAADGADAIDLFDHRGAAWINEKLGPYRFRVKKPPRRASGPADRRSAAAPLGGLS